SAIEPSRHSSLSANGGAGGALSACCGDPRPARAPSSRSADGSVKRPRCRRPSPPSEYDGVRKPPSRSSPVADRVRAAFVGAGNRAFSAHYPAVKPLSDEVELAAVCEVDPARLARGADHFELPPDRRYSDLNQMLAEVKPELVYTIMGPTFVRSVAE